MVGGFSVTGKPKIEISLFIDNYHRGYGGYFGDRT